MACMRLPLAVSVCLLLAACGDGIDEGVNQGRAPRGTIDGVTLHTAPDGTTPDTTDTTDTTDTGNDGDPFDWVDFGDGTEEGFLQVPLDHDDPDGEQITLYVARHKAVDPANRIGSLLVNPGGPGFGGSSLAYAAENVYGQALLDRFDIVAWDPRGTGLSDPAVDCIDDYDEYFALDSSPDTPSSSATRMPSSSVISALS